MIDKYLNDLEYFEILKRLENNAITYIGKEKVLALKPMYNKEKVKDELQQTTEALNAIYKQGNPGIFEIEKINIELKKLKNNAIISAKTLLDIADILKLSRELKLYFTEIENTQLINEYFEGLYQNIGIEENIFKVIIDDHTIDDRATTELFSIRKSQKRIEQMIREKLSSYLNSKYIQEPIITIREDRFVIPVKQEYRSEIKGFIHDISSSGATIFIEPLAVFELNNDLNGLKIKEKREIEKILQELSNQCREIVNELISNIELIGTIDFIFAKAKFARITKSSEPRISEKKEVNLKQAKHPLISSEKVVPIDINVGKEFTTLLITGPNTGGKTVALKTLGIVTLMAMSGLYIPTIEGSSIYVFDNVFTDIGDNQSIVESLSTFSSHINNLISIIKSATENSLILLDEIGGGTDPVEGAALAISILEYLNNKKMITIATTHYSQVKNYAVTAKNFENASFEFDAVELKPTYKLLMGVPGKSNAFEISKKLGLSEEILKSAKNYIDTSVISSEKLLKQIYDDKIAIEEEKENIESNLKEIEKIKQELIKYNTEQQQTLEKTIEDAKIKARKIYLEAEEEAGEIIKEIKSVSNKSEALNKKSEITQKIKSIKIEKNKFTSDLKPEEIQINMKVNVPSFNQQGIVVSLPNKDNEVYIQIGLMKVNLKITEIEKCQNQETSPNKGKVHSSSNLKTNKISNEINVIGLNIEEAIFVIDKYLDNCSLSALQKVRIVHGKGTGKLRAGIHQYLKTNPHVKTYRVGTFGEGEMGVTIVELEK